MAKSEKAKEKERERRLLIKRIKSLFDAEEELIDDDKLQLIKLVLQDGMTVEDAVDNIYIENYAPIRDAIDVLYLTDGDAENFDEENPNKKSQNGSAIEYTKKTIANLGKTNFEDFESYEQCIQKVKTKVEMLLAYGEELEAIRLRERTIDKTTKKSIKEAIRSAILNDADYLDDDLFGDIIYPEDKAYMSTRLKEGATVKEAVNECFNVRYGSALDGLNTERKSKNQKIAYSLKHGENIEDILDELSEVELKIAKLKNYKNFMMTFARREYLKAHPVVRKKKETVATQNVEEEVAANQNNDEQVVEKQASVEDIKQKAAQEIYDYLDPYTFCIVNGWAKEQNQSGLEYIAENYVVLSDSDESGYDFNASVDKINADLMAKGSDLPENEEDNGQVVEEAPVEETTEEASAEEPVEETAEEEVAEEPVEEDDVLKTNEPVVETIAQMVEEGVKPPVVTPIKEQILYTFTPEEYSIFVSAGITDPIVLLNLIKSQGYAAVKAGLANVLSVLKGLEMEKKVPAPAPAPEVRHKAHDDEPTDEDGRSK